MNAAAPELFSLVLYLRPRPVEHEPAPTHWWGRAAQHLLLSVAGARDPALADALHAENTPKPFSVSTLMGSRVHAGLDPKQTYFLRLSALQPVLAQILYQAAQPGGALAPGAQVELEYRPFDVLQAVWDEAQQPWAGCTTYAELAARTLTGAKPPARRLSLQFTSPTAVHTPTGPMAFPLPGVFLGSLLRRWNEFAPLAFPEELQRYAAECLAVSRFDIQSQVVPVKNGGMRAGCVGQVTYTALNYDRYWMCLAHTLVQFARFAGVGAGTALGFGQCRPVELAEREEAEG